jgi:hypothetical protein
MTDGSNQATEDAALDIPEGSVGRGRGHVPHAIPPPPPPRSPVISEDLLAT